MENLTDADLAQSAATLAAALLTLEKGRQFDLVSREVYIFAGDVFSELFRELQKRRDFAVRDEQTAA